MRSKSIFFALGLLLVYSIYRALYPGEEYYLAQFEHISGLKAPPTSKIIQGVASYPDFHGDFSSCFVLYVPINDLDMIKSETSFFPVDKTKSCNSSKEYTVVEQGRNAYENEFMSWYLTSNNEILGYYAQY